MGQCCCLCTYREEPSWQKGVAFASLRLALFGFICLLAAGCRTARRCVHGSGAPLLPRRLANNNRVGGAIKAGAQLIDSTATQASTRVRLAGTCIWLARAFAARCPSPSHPASAKLWQCTGGGARKAPTHAVPFPHHAL